VSSLHFGPDHPAETYVAHAYPEQTIDTGEAVINFAVAGSANKPALLLIPGQTESWWGYEQAMGLLQEHFQAFAVDLRGQGRSSRTPGRYTVDNFGNDLVRFILGAASDMQAKRVCELVSQAGQSIDYRSFPQMGHSMHGQDPKLFAQLLIEFDAKLNG
jgi:alpha-beta hydrolase superfamily lysophospholipase